MKILCWSLYNTSGIHFVYQFCVIFPPLCAQAAGLSEQAVQALSDDDVRLVTESDSGYVVRFRLLELWDALVQRLS